MGIERYKIIRTFEHKDWLKDAPIKIEKSQLLLDTLINHTVLQIKMFNLSDEIIRSVYLDINCFDDAMDYVKSLVDINYLSVDVKPQSNFGDRQPIILESLQIANVEIIIKKVVFTDGAVWRNDDKKVGISLPEQLLINTQDVLYEQIVREFKGKNTKPYYWIENNEDNWRCTCGQANSWTTVKCGYCGTEKDWLEKHLNKDYLIEEDREYQEKELMRKKKELEEKHIKAEEEKRVKEEKTRRDQEAEKHKEELRIQNEFKKKKLIRIIIIVLSFCAVVIVAGIAYKNILSPYITYNKALHLYEDEKYEDASEVFIDIIGYKNSKQMLIDSNYLNAKQIYESEHYEKSINAFKALGNYKDSEDMTIQSIYNYGIKLLESGDYSFALTQFSEVETYADTDEYINECHYQIGYELSNDKNWEEAIKEFTISKNHKDSYNKIQECYFQIANTFMHDEDWDNAIKEYEKIDINAIDEDVNTAISSAYYQYGLYYAANLSWNKAIDCMNMAISKDAYKDAKSLIADYNDILKKNELAADYNEAIKFEENGRLDLAYNIYKKLPDDYEDCSDRMNRIMKYINYCGEYEGVAEYSAKTMEKQPYKASNSTAIVTITFEKSEPVINIIIEGNISSDNYKGKLKDMPISVIEEGSFESKIVIRFSDGILYRDWYIDNTTRTTILKFKKI